MLLILDQKNKEFFRVIIYAGTSHLYFPTFLVWYDTMYSY